MASEPCGVRTRTGEVIGPVSPPAFVLSEDNHRLWLFLAAIGAGSINVYLGRFTASDPGPYVRNQTGFLVWQSGLPQTSPLLYKDYGPLLQEQVWASVAAGVTLHWAEGTASILPEVGGLGECIFGSYTQRVIEYQGPFVDDATTLFLPNQRRITLGQRLIGGPGGVILSEGKRIIDPQNNIGSFLLPYRDFGDLIRGFIEIEQIANGSQFFEVTGL